MANIFKQLSRQTNKEFHDKIKSARSSYLELLLELM